MRQPYETFKAFADETRLRILSLLSHGEMCVSDLDAILGAGQADWAQFQRTVRRVPAGGREGEESHAQT
jgi:DNA-binding transcriptional ArsR family regulator